MNKKFHNFLMGVSVLPALAVMPAMASVAGETEIKNQILNHAYYYLNNNDDVLLSGGNYVGNSSDSSANATLYQNRRFGVVAFIETGSKLTVKNSVFKDNALLGDGGGALATGVGTGLLDVENSQFISNHSQYDGGAVGNYGGLTIKNSLFKGNTAHYALDSDGNYTVLVSDSNPVGGGAISLGAVSSTIVGSISGTTFEGNKSGTVGGAIGTRLGKSAHNSTAKLDIAATFTGNEAKQDGGAIYNTFYANNGLGKGDGVTVSSIFSGNKAGRNGGAVYNDGAKDLDNNDGGVMTFSGSTFNDNIAATNGGAIYNTGTVYFAGTNTFSGNKANNVANDIHNIGTVTVASGTTTIDGGITGDGELVVANGATLNIGTASVEQGTITLGGTMAMTLREGDAQITAGTFDGDGTLNLTLSGEGTYHVFGNAVFANAKNSVYDLEWNGGDVTATMKSVEDIAEEAGIAQETAAVVAGASKSTSEKLNDLAVKMQEKLAEGTPEAKQEVEKAAKAVHPETESVTQSVATAVQTTVTNLAGARMAAPRFGRNGGDVRLTSGGVWAQGLFNKSKQNDAFSGYTRGVAAGMDGTINKVWTIGAGYSYAHSDITGTQRDTEIDSNTIFVYGQYKPAAWYVNTVLNYTMSDFSEEGIVMGTPVTGDYDVDSFGGSVMTGYDFATGITPELGLRYMHVNADDYTNSLGVKTKAKDTDFLTGVLGAKYAFNINMDRYTKIIPQLNAAVKYDMLSDRNMATVTMPGVDAYTLRGERLNRLGGEFGIGLGLKYKSVDFSINYDIDVRKDYTSQTGMLKFRYNF